MDNRGSCLSSRNDRECQGMPFSLKRGKVPISQSSQPQYFLVLTSAPVPQTKWTWYSIQHWIFSYQIITWHISRLQHLLDWKTHLVSENFLWYKIGLLVYAFWVYGQVFIVLVAAQWCPIKGLFLINSKALSFTALWQLILTFVSLM
jgi:hypothetical protein